MLKIIALSKFNFIIIKIVIVENKNLKLLISIIKIILIFNIKRLDIRYLIILIRII